MKTSAFKRAQLFEGGDGFAAQFEQALCVFAEQITSGGQCSFARDALKKRFADFFFEATDRVADSRLSAAKAHGGTRESALFDYGEESFELRKVHKFN